MDLTSSLQNMQLTSQQKIALMQGAKLVLSAGSGYNTGHALGNLINNPNIQNAATFAACVLVQYKSLKKIQEIDNLSTFRQDLRDIEALNEMV